MKLLITGANGQLGHELVQLSAQHQILALGREDLDISDEAAVLACCGLFQPDAVINAAAYTAVDRAESDVAAAFAVNRDGPAHLAKYCQQADIPLIHVSTDYVFDGSKSGSYLETDPLAPLGVYGASKEAGEQAVRKGCVKFIILRTSWVFSDHGNNFVKTMLRLGVEREALSIVADQHGCPTSAAELARAIYCVLAQDLHASQWGTYHFCQPVPATWFSFAQAIFDEARDQGMPVKVKTINAISSSDYPTPAQRPVNSVLDCSKFMKTFAFKIRPWQDSLSEVIRALQPN